MSGLYRFPLFSTPLHHVENLKYLHHFRVVERWWRSGGEKFEMLKTRKQQSMSTANRVIKNTGYLYAKMGITMFVSLYTTRLILNSLGASDFGIFNIVGGAIAMLGFLNAAMASATQRFMSYAEGEGIKSKQKSIFNVSFVLHILISLLVGIALLIAGYFFFNGILNIPPDRIFAAQVVYGSLIISTMFTVMTVPYDAVMNAHENMLYYAIVGIIESFLKLAVAFACVYTTSDKLIVYGILMACIPLITLTIMRVYCHKHYEECIIAPKRYFDKGLMKEMTSFAGWNFFQSFAAIVTNYGTAIVINMFFGTIVNAAQGVANQICGQLMALTTTMTKAINPVIVKTAGEKNNEKVISYALSSSKATHFVTSLLALPAIITMPELLQIWLKEVPQYAVFFAQCQLIIALCEQSTQGLNSAIIASGKIKGYSITKSITKFLYLPISYILFKCDISIIIVYFILVFIQGIINGIIIPLMYISNIYHFPLRQYLKHSFSKLLIITFSILILGEFMNLYLQSQWAFIFIFPTCMIVHILLSYTLLLDKKEKETISKVAFQLKHFIKK